MAQPGKQLRHPGRLLAVGLVIVLATTAFAQESTRIIDGKPYDQLTLKEDMQVLKLEPIKMEKRRPVTKAPDPEKKLLVKLYGKPEQSYEVTWVDIEKLELFEELVLKEAAQLVTNEKFEQAYPYFQYLQDRDAEFPGLSEGLQSCLFHEAQYWHKQEAPAQALALLNEVYRRNAEYKDLSAGLGKISDELATKHAAAGDYRAARSLIKNLRKKFADNPVVAKWEQDFSQQAAKALASARTKESAGDLRGAYHDATVAIDRWPSEEGAAPFLKQLHAKYPIVTVGVSQPSARGADLGASWSARRSRRLLYRMLVEPTGVGLSGIQYTLPLAELAATQKGFTLTAVEKAAWSDGRPITAFDIARTLVDISNPQQPSFLQSWASVMGSVQVSDPRTVEVEIRHRYPEIAALLQVPLVPWDTSAGSGTSTITAGPYRRDHTDEANARYLAIEKYFARGLGQPRELVERHFVDTRSAIRALTEGEIVAIDRVDVLDHALASKQKNVTVVSYAIPTVHMLVPNLARRLPAQRAYRRAVAYGINRPRVLRDAVLRGATPELGKVISGPFPTGSAYNDQLPDYPYDPRMSVAMVAVAEEEANAGRPKSDSEPKGLGKLVIAYPPTSTARRACKAIAGELAMGGLGFDVELKELEADTIPEKLPEYCDFLYVEWPAMDPLVDARRLFGTGGLAGGVGGWLPLAVRTLEQTSSSQDAQLQLKEIHRLCQVEAAVIPLWQIVEHAAVRRDLTGVGENLITLYQNIEGWKSSPWIPAE